MEKKTKGNTENPSGAGAEWTQADTPIEALRILARGERDGKIKGMFVIISAEEAGADGAHGMTTQSYKIGSCAQYRSEAVVAALLMSLPDALCKDVIHWVITQKLKLCGESEASIRKWEKETRAKLNAFAKKGGHTWH